MTDKVYSTTLTGAGFRFYEFKVTVSLIEEGLTDEEIRKKVFEENLFQQKASSTTRSFPYILKRARALNDQLRQYVLEESNQMAKQINFYAIMKTDLLFYEFMDELIKNKLQNNDLIYERKDINIFFNEKADENEQLANWSESTLKRLKSSYNRLLIEIGYLTKLSSTDLIPVQMDDLLRDYLIKIGDKKYIEAMEG
ncbi:membrane protein [Vagococcus lutrae]|uniref:DUF1819 family protein n=1 Tax=Vagococcus TaxID=2737 RepID=UPI000EB97D6B|nr:MULTISPECIES: DUF1819 family protein [Vagococcus]RST92256.1 hypothetical protein CBF33_04665 [Vagococcus lutrae]GEQ61298.1 membrane protein [Vagococcus lutrae]GEQ63257.1 membrane protein [Vagococcus lutrae]GEQ65148.1 membrane protein [Vagococcus lutrae]HCT96456.1 DUF1819 domain-containing protein [Vagococcus sp.]